MPQRLVVCCDGTWFDPSMASASNVRRLHNALLPTDADGRPQRSHYEPGVGTEGGLLRRLLGGAAGAGLSQDILDAYQWLATAYQPGDSIALFGFSRGAYTARSLAGLITASGLIDLDGLNAATAGRHVHRAYAHYRARENDRRWRTGLHFRFDPDDATAMPVDFIGVWDTVGSLGIPTHLAGINLLVPMKRLEFRHNVNLNPHIQHARHALAMDERRRPFTPTLWENTVPGQDVEQRWFPGSHMDVGGGHLRTGLSDGALQWMVDEAARTAGLRFSPHSLRQIVPDPVDVQHDDNRGVFNVVPLLTEPLLDTLLQIVWQLRPRAVPPLVAADSAEQHVRVTQTLDPSVRQRQEQQPITSGPYRSGRLLRVGQTATIEVFARELWNDTGLYLEPGSYRFQATGQWLDGWIWSGPEGTTGWDRFRPTVLPRHIGTLIGQGVRIYRSVTGQQEATAPGAPREVDLPWMCLVGYIANDAEHVQGAPGNRGHERIALGSHTTHQVSQAGYFYAYANDAWGFYGNNRGSVHLTVTRSA
ncbi:DUF2235 domain-containing protein [Streptomyces purpurogeneiscleroticus]|uniref:DUF2235 domain-containing protein n=1 Tax=Streptomyces purpurogeneiscleroticus TaxID=68259 RepID=UPI001CBB38C1|nr:DUF2235 domain-containing protein [Streptomyces purpurogeneiscleroticus]MBZ4015039.1 hypothetical protein [Streptomyces purpurogeneiscleroticus]